jgi:hypothetical protein
MMALFGLWIREELKIMNHKVAASDRLGTHIEDSKGDSKVRTMYDANFSQGKYFLRPGGWSL